MVLYSTYDTMMQDTYQHTVRNYSKEFLSQMIEAFDDDAVRAIIHVS